MSNFITHMLGLLESEENIEIFNKKQKHVRAWNNNNLFFVYNRNKETRNCFKYLPLSVKLYIIRTALKSLPFYEKEHKEAKFIRENMFSSLYRDNKEYFLQTDFLLRFTGKTLCDLYLHALNQDNWEEALNEIWESEIKNKTTI
jgi:hypothetical protein